MLIGVTDACVTSSLGPRWAFAGPYMSNVSGGGGGRTGFKHLQAHVGATSQIWTDDMNAHAFEFSKENIDLLDQSVQLLLDDCDEQAMEVQRDSLLIDLLKAKKGASALI